MFTTTTTTATTTTTTTTSASRSTGVAKSPAGKRVAPLSTRSQGHQELDNYVYVCIYTYISTYVYIYIYIHTRTHICMYVCVYIYIYIYTIIMYCCIFIYLFIPSCQCARDLPHRRHLSMFRLVTTSITIIPSTITSMSCLIININ